MLKTLIQIYKVNSIRPLITDNLKVIKDEDQPKTHLVVHHCHQAG